MLLLLLLLLLLLVAAPYLREIVLYNASDHQNVVLREMILGGFASYSFYSRSPPLPLSFVCMHHRRKEGGMFDPSKSNTP
ncbi:uncharacterized protein BO95DRAFT_438489 [Aspergillus brunneoviolaceus CBS 621.78]|uniref:Uncharacterized protein n=1 Tax=Aspergillus brunneoviolaceus CBS 621.78 TaxID=1450534 RepID=A0ACD1GNH1_9EURO|nr:hypothetical protein BO95DRAFT_438489 [Aspergillus brunneoviolaceus CBS 621.78]RAH50725.1 hypothetical protein BO95DRAFT_438489 [Aspergillus brunneoviolaceus CBS 621.78]